MNKILHLANTLQSEGQALVFLGAGSSMEGSQDDNEFPDFETLIDRVLADEGVNEAGDKMSDFLNVMRKWERESTLSVRLSQYLYGNPGISHLRLASATLSLFPDVNMAVYLTTNFDDLMYKALAAVSKNAPQRDPKSFSLSKSAIVTDVTRVFRAIPRHTQAGTPVVLKLFGDLASNSPIFDPDDMPFDEFTEEKLIDLFDRPAIFIGYGFRDAPILSLLARSKSQSPVFVVSPNNVIRDTLPAVSQRAFYWLDYTFSDFMTELVETFASIRPNFESNFTGFLRSADTNLLIGSQSAQKDFARSASKSALDRFNARFKSADEAVSSIDPVPRPDTGPDFSVFLEDVSRILALVGESGCGKSTLLRNLYLETVDKTENLCVYYDVHSFQSAGSISSKIAQDLMVEDSKLRAVMLQLADELHKRDAKFLVFIDALNESVALDPRVLRYEIESLATQSPSNVKFIFTCRRVFWDAYMNISSDLPVELYFERKLSLLSGFSSREAEVAFGRYADAFRLKTPFHSLSITVKKHVRDPLMLRLVASVYSGGDLPEFAPAVVVFKRVLDRLRRQYLRTPLMDYLDALIEMRISEFWLDRDVGDVFEFRLVRSDPNLALLAQQQLSGQFHKVHPLTILEDENVIAPLDKTARIFKFSYERFFEYLLGERLHYTFFTTRRISLNDFLSEQIENFIHGHYSFYQGLKNALILAYLDDADASAKAEILALLDSSNIAIVSLVHDVLREAVFESGLEPIQAIKEAGLEGEAEIAFALDLAPESASTTVFAIEGLFSNDMHLRSRSAWVLVNQSNSEARWLKTKAMFIEQCAERHLDSEVVRQAAVYFLCIALGRESDKTAGLEDVRNLLALFERNLPNIFSRKLLLQSVSHVLIHEVPIFFGANYGPESITYPWDEDRGASREKRQILTEWLSSDKPPDRHALMPVISFFSKIGPDPARSSDEHYLFARQIEYRIVQWMLIRTWRDNRAAALALLDDLVVESNASTLDFAIGILEEACAKFELRDKDAKAQVFDKAKSWLAAYEQNHPEFYYALAQEDPFSYNLVPLAVLARLEAILFCRANGAILSIAEWLTDGDPKRRKMGFLAASWLSEEFTVPVLKSMETIVNNPDLSEWCDRVLSECQRHKPRLVDDFVREMRLSIERRTRIRQNATAAERGQVQHKADGMYAWLFLGPASRLRRIANVYSTIYATDALSTFCGTLFDALVWGDEITVKECNQISAD